MTLSIREYRGEWDALTRYYRGDVVFYLDRMYISTKELTELWEIPGHSVSYGVWIILAPSPERMIWFK